MNFSVAATKVFCFSMAIHCLQKNQTSGDSEPLHLIFVYPSDFLQIILLNSMIGYWHNPVVCPFVCDAVHCGSQGWCTGLRVVPVCS